MSPFNALMLRAQTLQKFESDPIRSDWWAGYIRGLRRAHHGERFGTQAQHDLWLAAIRSSDEQRAALGRGYRAGLTLTAGEPE